MALFYLGTIVLLEEARSVFAEKSKLIPLLQKHVCGDWGKVHKAKAKNNTRHLQSFNKHIQGWWEVTSVHVFNGRYVKIHTELSQGATIVTVLPPKDREKKV